MVHAGFEPIIPVTERPKFTRLLQYTVITISLFLFRPYESVVSIIVFINLTDGKIGNEQA
jgi:hypothetical protein